MLGGSTLHLIKPPRPTQPVHPCVGINIIILLLLLSKNLCSALLSQKSLMHSLRCQYVARAQPHFKNWGVYLSLLSLQTSNYGDHRHQGERNGEGCPPLQPTLSGLWKHCELPWWAQGQSPSRRQFWGVSCAILCDIMHVLVHLTAVWKWEIPTSLYWLVGLIILL